MENNAVAVQAKMKVSFMSPFVDGATQVIERESGITFTRGALNVLRAPHTTHEVTIMLGVSGEAVQGLVMYNLSRETAMELASRMVGEPFSELSELAQSAVAELGNMITGLAATKLAEGGYPAMITPPALILGQGCMISTLDVLRLVVPLESSIGTVEIQIGLVAKH
jgi:chemotaxis protein CheX